MKRWGILVVLLVGLSAAGTMVMQYLPDRTSAGGPEEVAILSGSSDSSAGPKPKLKIVSGGDTTYNFGTLPQRATGKHTWTIKNEGEGDLEIWMAHATCSCTVAKFKDGTKAIVKPGETTEIDLEFETRENNGEYVKGAEIGSNDPAMLSFPLNVKGLVFPAVQTYPPEPVANLSTISNDEPAHVVKFAVYSKDRPETKVVKVTCSSKNIEAVVRPMSADEKKRMPPELTEKAEIVSITVKDTLPLGLFREEVIVTTDHPKQPEVRYGVAGSMLGPVNLQPARLIMHDVSGKAGAAGELAVVVRNKRPTKVEIVKKPDGVQAEILPAANGAAGRYRLVVTVPPGTPPVRIEELIVLKTDHPKAAELKVPLSIWVLNSN